MANYFVDPVNGSDSNTATQAQNPATAWASFAHAIGAASFTMSGTGDTVWLIPTAPYRARNIALSLTPGTGNILTIQGDFDGAAQRAAGATTVYTGPCIWTAYTTNDTTWPADTNSLLQLNGKSYITLQNLVWIGGRNTTAACINASATSTNITIKSCMFNVSLANAPAIAATIGANIVANWMIDSCISFAPSFVSLSINQSATAQWSIASTIQNCLCIGFGNNTQVYIAGGTTSTYNGYGLLVTNCSMLHGSKAIYSSVGNGTSVSTDYQITVYNCTLWGGGQSGISCANGTNSFIYEDYNMLYDAPVSNVTSGGHSQSVASTNLASPSVHVGEETFWGMVKRPFLMPWAASSLLGFGAGGSPPAYDFLGKPRPAGGSATSAAGYLERQDTGAKSTTYAQSGSSSLKIAGPGTQEFKIPVASTATTITIYALYDSSYGAGAAPSAEILANGEIGVAQQGPTAMSTSGGAGVWTQISLGPFTPTATGIVTLRLISAAAATGNAYFDTACVPHLDTSSMDYYNRGEPIAVLDSQSSAGSSGVVGSRIFSGF